MTSWVEVVNKEVTENRRVRQLTKQFRRKFELSKKQKKGIRGMPRLSEATKDVVSCEKLRGVANKR